MIVAANWTIRTRATTIPKRMTRGTTDDKEMPARAKLHLAEKG
jgi:hypothetical protein